MSASYAYSVVLYVTVFIITAFMAGRFLRHVSDSGTICYINKKRHNTLLILYVVTFIATLVAGLRYGIGTDYNLTYVMYFNTCRTPNYHGNKYELIFYLINCIVSYCGGTVNLVLYIASVVTFVCYIKGALFFKDHISIGFSVFIYLVMSYNNTLNNTRQWVAVAVVFWGIKYCFERKPIKYILCIIIAMGFHISAICALPMYFIISRGDMNENPEVELKRTAKKVSKTRNNLIIMLMFVLIIVGQFSITILEYLGLSYYVPYLTRIQFVGYINWVAIIRYAPWIVAIIYIMLKSKYNYRMYVCALFSLVGLIVEIVAMHVSIGGFEQIHRMANYFTCFLPIVAGALCHNSILHGHKIRLNMYSGLMILVLVIVIAGWVNDIVINNANATLPYVTIFSK